MLLTFMLTACLPPPPPGMNLAAPNASPSGSAVADSLAPGTADPLPGDALNILMPLVASSAGQWYVWWEDTDRREPIGRLSVGELFSYFYSEGSQPTGFISEHNEVFLSQHLPANRQLCVIRVKLPCAADSAVLLDGDDTVVCATRREGAARNVYQRGDYIYLVAPANAENLTLTLSRRPAGNANVNDDDAGEFICSLDDLASLLGQSSVEGNYHPSSKEQRDEMRTVEINVASWPSASPGQKDGESTFML